MLTTLIKELLRGKRARRDHAAELVTRGIARQQAGELGAAEDLYREALERDPRHVDALHLLGAVLAQQRRLDEAVMMLTELVTREPTLAEAHFTLAGCLSGQGELAQAEAHYRRVIALNAGFVPAYINLSNLLRLMDRMEETVRCLEQAIALEPGSAEAHHNLGKALYENGRGNEALPSFERAIALAPGDADMRYNFSEALLWSGDFARGWQEYEYRFDMSHDAPLRRPFSHPSWHGEPLAGRALLVWGEQGIGDEISFAATYPELIALGARCVFECAPKLVPLFTRSFPDAVVAPRSDPPHPATTQGIDYQCAAGSLGRYLRPGLASFPSRPAYLGADPGRVRHWRERFAALGPGLTSGFCWRSSNTRGKRALSCTRLEDWVPLVQTPGTQWVCLQYDPCDAELEAVRRASGIALHRFPEVDYFDDLAEVAAMMQALDLVISAPTVVSVQAAALGVETWQMSYGPDWQTHGAQANVWYPRMVRFERRPLQGWPEVIGTIAHRLRKRTASRAAGTI